MAWTYTCNEYGCIEARNTINRYAVSHIFAGILKIVLKIASPIFRREHFLNKKVERSAIVGLKIFRSNSQVSIILITFF